LRHRGTEFDVEEGPPSWWHWTIYPGAGPDATGETKFRSREAAVAACIEEINIGIERSRHARQDRTPRGYRDA
jgi:hypothetical protein